MGKRKRLHRQAVINGEEAPFRNSFKEEKPEEETPPAKPSMAELKDRLKSIKQEA